MLEIDGQDSFRIRSYRNAAQAIENHAQQIKDIISEPKQVLAIPGIGKGMLANLQELFKEGHLSAHTGLLEKYHPSMLQLLKIQGLGPKTIALIWSAYQVSDVDGVEKLAREGKIRTLPRMGEKHELKLIKAIEDYRRIGGRYLIDHAEVEAAKLTQYLSTVPGIDKITPAGSLRQRALKMGYTLSEYSLADLKTNNPVAGKTEEEIYAKLNLDYIPPEMRENLGEIDLAAAHKLPQLITAADLQGDVHMHTVET